MHGPLDGLDDPQYEIDDLRLALAARTIEMENWRLRAQAAEQHTNWLDRYIKAEKYFAKEINEKDKTIALLRQYLSEPRQLHRED